VPFDQLEVLEHPLAMLDLAPGQLPQGMVRFMTKPAEAGGIGGL
jgi:hypothetical protein